MAGEVVLASGPSGDWWADLASRAHAAGLALPPDPSDTVFQILFGLVGSKCIGFADAARAESQKLHADLEQYSREFVEASWHRAVTGTEFGGHVIEAKPYLLEETMSVNNLFPLPAVIGWTVESKEHTYRAGWQLLVDTFATFVPWQSDAQLDDVFREMCLDDIRLALTDDWRNAQVEAVEWGSRLWEDLQ